ncbi:General transcription factor II-I repeat domain-containing protein 2A-like [Oopsacas minuta]|uniref:General transcription factor II-I repeat domain-containing protein 2A-like n=1 Tax=Oopsacas minuta TaxID=111878 RepID=A0AAV7JRL0_9METZ|nr:General transcription factor II-I repeat domain-containing protein 2A-like [Oopsacas minuta]
MLGTGTGFKGQVLRWLTEISKCHCIIHQEALCAKTLGLENVMKLIVDVVNFIRSKGVNHRESKEFLKDLVLDYGGVLYFTSVRWLSRGVVLKRVGNYEMKYQELQLELVDLQSSIDLKADFKDVGVISFYKTLPSDIYPAIFKHARRIASLFVSTYTCEALFSKMKFIKNKYRSSLTDDHLQDVLHTSSPDMKPNIDTILIQLQKQYQPSH